MTAAAPARDLERTQQDILRVATQHFTRAGYYGARVDEIAAETATTKRMIYYCFGSKSGLFAACLDAALDAITRYEDELHVAELAPGEGVALYVRATLRYHEEHPELALLLRSENLQEAVHLGAHTPRQRPVIARLDALLARGRASGEFRADASALDIHLVVSALANYRITNEPTIAALFGFSTRESARLDRDVDQYVGMILGWLRTAIPPAG